MNRASRPLGRLSGWLRNPSRLIELLLVFVPVALILAWVQASPTLVFVAASLAIIPLAGVLGDATETLAEHVGARAGALMNATFGNAAELIITIAAIRAGLIQVVKASITGSILGNLLLVMGLSVLFGGLRNGFQRFDRRGVSVMMTTMTIAVIGLVIPAIFEHSIEQSNRIGVEYLSIGVATALIAGYALSLLFTFRLGKVIETPTGEAIEEAEPRFPSARLAFAVLLVAVLLVAVLSEVLVGAIEPVVRAQGLTEFFVGVIIVPIIGNAAEHLVAIEMALKNRMELALGVAVGSSMQIALFVSPLLVFISLGLGQELTLIFNQFELAALAAAVIITALIALDGETNWLEGAQLLLVYVILAMAFFFLPA